MKLQQELELKEILVRGLLRHREVQGPHVDPGVNTNNFGLKRWSINIIKQNACERRATEDSSQHTSMFLDISSLVKQNERSDDNIIIKLSFIKEMSDYNITIKLFLILIFLILIHTYMEWMIWVFASRFTQ